MNCLVNFKERLKISPVNIAERKQSAMATLITAPTVYTVNTWTSTQAIAHANASA